MGEKIVQVKEFDLVSAENSGVPNNFGNSQNK